MIMSRYNNLSVVISTFNREEYVNQLLSSIEKQSILPKEIIIVDSSPIRISYKHSKLLNVNIVKSEKAQLTYQRNLGVSRTNCDIILHIDDDTILEVDYIKNILETFNNDKNNQIDVVGGYISNEWGNNIYEPNIIMVVLKFFGIYDGELLPGRVSNSGIFIELSGLNKNIGIYKTDFISGTSFAVKSNVYGKYRHPEKINKYGGEDKAFSRLISKDFNMVICTKARLKHLFAKSGNRDSDFSSHKNTVRFMIHIQKNYPKKYTSTIKLRLYYLFHGLRFIVLGIIGPLIRVKFRKNIIRILEGLGYLSGSVSIN